jgi:2-succinyl-6-hydroxy-2,4-cyclohexadiene-1-carboxylate synthase
MILSQSQNTNALFCQIVGDRTLPAITFLHGFLGSSKDWSSIAHTISDRFCCLLIDLPGHGKSLLEADELYLMPATAELVVAILHRHQIPKSYLYGYSMGGRLALYLAIHFPQLFPQVILESASPGLALERDRVMRQQHEQKLADRLEQNFPQFLQDWYDQPLFATLKQHPQFPQIFTQRSQQNPRLLAKSLRQIGLGMQPNLWPDLANLQMPLRLIAGERDRKFIAIQQEIQRFCPKAMMRTVENTGHNVNWENPAAIVREISGFDSSDCPYDAAT